jgi:hypothetical protein
VKRVVVIAVAACSNTSPSPNAERAASTWVAVSVATANGLSGLAADDTGALWTVAERAEQAYRIVLDAELVPTIETFAVRGVPPGTDLEGMAVLGPDRFAFGTEGRTAGVAQVLVADKRGAEMVVTGTIDLPASAIGVALADNHGAEGVCGTGDTIVAAIETVGVDGGKRWAPLAVARAGAIRVVRFWLTSPTGKIAGLDCRVDAAGAITGWVVERHFEVTKLLRFAVAADATEVVPEVALDLGPILRGAKNLEGIAALPDGRVVAVVDNQWKTITGPSELLVFTSSAVAPTASSSSSR